MNKYTQLWESLGKPEIKISSKAADSLPLDDIQDLQGGLKKRTMAKKLELAEKIFTQGFTAPFFIWNNKGDYFCMDGHGRSEVLCDIRKAGIPIPGLFPVAYIDAKDEQDAKEKLLSITTPIGTFDQAELSKWLDDFTESYSEEILIEEDEVIKSEIWKIEISGDDEIDKDEILNRYGHLKVKLNGKTYKS